MIEEYIISMVSHQNQLFGLTNKGVLYVWNGTMYTWDKVQAPTFLTEDSGE